MRAKSCLISLQLFAFIYLFNFLFGSIFHLIILVGFSSYIIISICFFQKNSNQKETCFVKKKYNTT